MATGVVDEVHSGDAPALGSSDLMYLGDGAHHGVSVHKHCDHAALGQVEAVNEWILNADVIAIDILASVQLQKQYQVCVCVCVCVFLTAYCTGWYCEWR